MDTKKLSESGVRVSVICPVYNAERYLEYCLISVVGQTYDNLEIVLVNDGSTDGSLAICRRVEETYTNRRIVIIDKKNEGVVRARERGVSEATGEISIFIDADDFYLQEDAIERIANAYKRSPFDVCLINAFHERFDRMAVLYPWASGIIGLEEARGVATTFRSKDGAPCDIGYAVIKAFRTELYPICNYEKPLTLFEDTLITMQLLDCAKKIYLINEAFYFYRNNDSSALMKSNMNERLRCCDILFSERDKYYEKWQLSPEWDLSLIASNQEIALAYLEQIAGLPAEQRQEASRVFCETSLCKCLLSRQSLPMRLDKQIALSLFRANHVNLAIRALGARRRLLATLRLMVNRLR